MSKGQDPNLVVDSKIDKTGLVFRSVFDEPFCVHGVFYENGKFRRMPESVANTVNPGVIERHANTAGGRVRFKTNSKRVAIVVLMPYVYYAPHCCLTGTAGFDLYVRHEGEEIPHFRATFVPPVSLKTGYESVKELDGEMVEVTINMPLYSDVSELYIGVDEGAELLPAETYPNKAPIVYYGNSITQGACASRSGNAFATIASREVGYDFVNLGFSGWGRAELEMAEYVAGLDMDIFVYDYDFNAPNEKYLAETHERMFKIIREKHPSLPVVMLSRTSVANPAATVLRREIIYKTYLNAKAAGDENVYFIDGQSIFPDFADAATVEGIHANDLGQAFIGVAIAKVLREIIAKR